MAVKKRKRDTRATLNVPAGKRVAAIAAVSPAPLAGFGAEGCCVREFWAVVERDGTLVRGRNVWRVARLSTGIYEVVFTGDVSNGVYTATIGRPGIATEPPVPDWRGATLLLGLSGDQQGCLGGHPRPQRPCKRPRIPLSSPHPMKLVSPLDLGHER